MKKDINKNLENISGGNAPSWQVISKDETLAEFKTQEEANRLSKFVKKRTGEEVIIKKIHR